MSRQSLPCLTYASHRGCAETAAIAPFNIQTIFLAYEEEREAASGDWLAVGAALAYAGLQLPYLKMIMCSAK